MTTGRGGRTGRAAVFAAVCVLLTTLGHTVMSGGPVPWWALSAGAAATGGAAWLLAGRERGLLQVAGVAVAAQAALHALFSLAQVTRRPEGSGRSLARRWLDRVLCAEPADPGTAGRRAGPCPGTGPDPAATDCAAAGFAHHSASGVHSTGATDPMVSVDTAGPLHSLHSLGAVGHDMGGMSPPGMLLAHLLAAVLGGLWLAYGERAAFRLARSCAAWLVAPLRLPLARPAPPHRPRFRARRPGSGRAPRPLLLTHALTSRGPPAPSAVT